jgi:ABC-type sugar transport system substrate-binding protein
MTLPRLAVALSPMGTGGSPCSVGRAGFTSRDRFVADTDFTEDGGHAATTELVRRGPDGVELVFAVNDVMAIGATRDWFPAATSRWRASTTSARLSMSIPR